MKKIKFIKYINHSELTKGVQYVPDEVAEFNEQTAFVLVNSGHAVYVPEPEKSKKVEVVLKPKRKPSKMSNRKVEVVIEEE